MCRPHHCFMGSPGRMSRRGATLKLTPRDSGGRVGGGHALLNMVVSLEKKSGEPAIITWSRCAWSLLLLLLSWFDTPLNPPKHFFCIFFRSIAHRHHLPETPFWCLHHTNAQVDPRKICHLGVQGPDALVFAGTAAFGTGD